MFNVSEIDLSPSNYSSIITLIYFIGVKSSLGVCMFTFICMYVPGRAKTNLMIKHYFTFKSNGNMCGQNT